MTWDKIAEQLLVGWPEVDSRILPYMVTLAELLWGLVSLCLASLAALAPDFVRDRRIDFYLPDDGRCRFVALSFLTMLPLHFVVCYVYPRGIMLLFTEMSKAYRIFSIMLTDEASAQRACVPHVRVGKPDDILAWYELYNYFILSTKRRKFSLEFSFAFNLFTVLGMTCVLAGYIIFEADDWKPGVLFCETSVILVSFLVFSLPPLFMGLRVNMLRRRTIDLLLAHAGEARAHLHYSVRDQTRDTDKSAAHLQEHAVYMAETIANRLRVDSWLLGTTPQSFFDFK